MKISLAVVASLFAAVSVASQAAEPTKSEKKQVQENLKRFDHLDFDAYSQRKDMKL